MVLFDMFLFVVFQDCTPSLYDQLPYQVYYANPGDHFCVVCNSTAISIQTMQEAFVSFVKAGTNMPACSYVPGCIVDTVADELCFTQGIPETSFGSYICRHAIDINNLCKVPFNITKAGKPTVWIFFAPLSFVLLSFNDYLIWIHAMSGWVIIRWALICSSQQLLDQFLHILFHQY